MKTKSDLLKSSRKSPQQKVLLDAKKYKTHSSWQKNNHWLILQQKKHGYFKEAIQHML